MSALTQLNGEVMSREIFAFHVLRYRPLSCKENSEHIVMMSPDITLHLLKVTLKSGMF